MVTAEQSTIRVDVFPWDKFLEEGARRRVEGFRRTEWPSIRRDLGRAYGYILPDGLEPCWVEPGKAMLWQEQQVTRPAQNDAGITTMQTFGQGDYQPVRRPANNASLIANDLHKGLLIRPLDQVVVEEGTLALAEEPDEPVNYTYHCYRHGDSRGFATWKAYLQHCRFYIEAPEEEPPQEVLAQARKFEFYCYIHQVGFNDPAGAQRHFTVETRRPQNKKGFHVPLDEMRVKKQEKENVV